MLGRARGGEVGVVPRDDALRSEKSEVVGQTMRRSVRAGGHQSLVIDLLPLFFDGGYHDITFIDEDKRLVATMT